MNRKLLLRIIFVLILTIGASNVFAAGAGGTLKGEIIALGGGSITVEKPDGTTVIVTLPAGFDATTLEIGDSVLAKGELQEDGSLLSDTVKVLGGPSDGNDGDNPNKGSGNNNGKNEKEEDGGLANNPFCSEEKEEPHPLSVGLSETYGASQEDVMNWFCEGNSFGAIMLALQTAELNGGDAASILATRGEGSGWGQIWKELGLVGNSEDAESPPGHLKRPSWAGPPEGKGPGSGEPDGDD